MGEYCRATEQPETTHWQQRARIQFCFKSLRMSRLAQTPGGEDGDGSSITLLIFTSVNSKKPLNKSRNLKEGNLEKIAFNSPQSSDREPLMSN